MKIFQSSVLLFHSASTNGKKASSFTVHAGSTVPLYISTPQNGNEKQTKNAMLGQYLQGTMSIAKVWKITFFK